MLGQASSTTKLQRDEGTFCDLSRVPGPRRARSLAPLGRSADVALAAALCGPAASPGPTCRARATNLLLSRPEYQTAPARTQMSARTPALIERILSELAPEHPGVEVELTSADRSAPESVSQFRYRSCRQYSTDRTEDQQKQRRSRRSQIDLARWRRQGFTRKMVHRSPWARLSEYGDDPDFNGGQRISLSVRMNMSLAALGDCCHCFINGDALKASTMAK